MSGHCGCRLTRNLEGIIIRDDSACRYPAALEAIRGLRELLGESWGVLPFSENDRPSTQLAGQVKAILEETEPYEVK